MRPYDTHGVVEHFKWRGKEVGEKLRKVRTQRETAKRSIVPLSGSLCRKVEFKSLFSTLKKFQVSHENGHCHLGNLELNIIFVIYILVNIQILKNVYYERFNLISSYYSHIAIYKRLTSTFFKQLIFYFTGSTRTTSRHVAALLIKTEIFIRDKFDKLNFDFDLFHSSQAFTGQAGWLAGCLVLISDIIEFPNENFILEQNSVQNLISFIIFTCRIVYYIITRKKMQI